MLMPPEWAAALADLSLAHAMRGVTWAYPLVETLHILGFSVLVGSIVVVDLRLLGLGRALSAQALMRHVLPWTAGAFCVVVPTGALLFLAHADELAGNPAFIFKLLLIALGLINVALFHVSAKRGLPGWDGARPPPARVRAMGGVSLLVWLGTICLGRLIAYV
jgi:hypothetical protein